MKKLYTILIVLLITASTFAQAPEKMSYQAVVRDASNTLLTNQEVGMQISILQTTITGTAVYIETQTATTNINGLVSLEIGTGSTSDNFSAIDWSAGPYFIKTATDPSGGSSYSITGTSQIMSVPFAMYAKTSGSSTPGPQGAPGIQGVQGDTGATGTSGADGATGADGPTGALGETGAQGDIGATGAPGIQGATGSVGAQGDIGVTGADGAAGTNGTQGVQGVTGAPGIQGATGSVGVQGGIGETGADGQGGVTQAGTGINVSGAGTEGSPYVVKITSPCGLAIGDTYQGGLIFYLDASGCHGLIAAPSDQNSGDGIQWYNGSFTNTTAFASCVGCGDGNTSMVVYNQGSGSYAAVICQILSLGEKSDWYLPSKYELNLMYQNIGQGNALNLGNIGDFASSSYWSSTEDDNGYAWGQNFYYGDQYSFNKSSISAMVRAVRAF
jgi:hypothetical protein